MDGDAIIIGGGLVGSVQALALSAHGLSTIVVDAADLAATRSMAFDGRVSAIASASGNMLGAIGLGDVLDQHGCPILEIRVTDGLSPLHLHFDSAEADGRPLGHMVENRLLRAALHDAVAAAPGVRLIAPAQVLSVERGEGRVEVETSKGRFVAPLVIAADGRNSPLRAAAGIRTATWDYPGTSLVTTIAHDLPHGEIAFELFYEHGPFAILPMLDGPDGEHRSAIVWTVAARDADGWAGLHPNAFARVLKGRMDGFLGDVRLLTPVSRYALKFQRAGRLIDRRLALIGDAAHTIHPIAGQGLNLGLRDAAALTQALVEGTRLGLDPGSGEVLRRYSAWRPLDIGAIGAATDLLDRLFRARGLGPVRRLGLAGVNAIQPLKRAFMAGARGELGERPALLRGELA
ncbi:MAG: FAD-dependent monooxygenase [Sphingomonadaceae bacterium]|nr:FAD-dependent monooxygenase [Sphingomonadaceae bacterium]